MQIDNPLNASPLAFPILECIHIVGFAVSIGTIAIVDLRLLGIGMRRETPSQLLQDTSLWTLGGLVVMLFSGLMLFSSDPDNYYLNYAFDLKMVFFLLAILFNYTIHRKVAQRDSAQSDSRGGKAVACISLALWSLVV